MSLQRDFTGVDDLSSPGKRIRFLRLARELSQEALAAKIYTTQPAISQWEKDKWLPSRASQHLLAEALGTTRHFLFGDAVETKAPVAS